MLLGPVINILLVRTPEQVGPRTTRPSHDRNQTMTMRIPSDFQTLNRLGQRWQDVLDARALLRSLQVGEAITEKRIERGIPIEMGALIDEDDAIDQHPDRMA